MTEDREQWRDVAARHRAILAASLDSIVTMTAEGRIQDFNPAAEKMFGWSAREVTGRMLAETIVPPELRERHQEGLRRYLREGSSDILGNRIELPAVRKGGERFTVEVSIHAITARDGSPFFTGYLRDITERKRADAALAQRAALAELHSALAVAISGPEPISDVLDACCREIVDRLGIDSARIWLRTADSYEMRLAAGAGSLPGPGEERRRIDPETSTIGRIAAEDTTVMLEASELRSLEGDRGIPAGRAAFAGYPLRVDRRVLGVLDLLASDPVPREALEALSPMADAIAQCVARKETEKRIRANEARLRDSEQELVQILAESEAANAKLRVLFDHSAHYAGLLDLDGTVTDVNRTALIECGYRREDVVGRPFWETGYWRGSKATQDAIREAVAVGARGERFRRELPFWLADGTERIADFLMTPATDETGGVRFLLPTGVDITERREAEEQLKRQTEIDRFLGDASAALSSSLDYRETLSRVAELCIPVLADWAFIDLLEEDGEVTRVSVAHRDPDHAELAQRVAQFPARRQAMDHPPARGLYGAEAFVIPEFTEEMLSRAAQSPEHEAVMRAVGPRSFVVVPLVARGASLGVLTLLTAQSGRRFDDDDLRIAEDLGRRAAIAIDNARLFEAAQRANRAKSEFLANMSHEIRTPMTAVLGYTELLARRETDAEKQKLLATVQRNGRFLLDIINDILDLSKIEAGKMELDSTSVTTVDILNDLRSMMSVRATEKGLDFAIEISGAVPASFESDPKRIRQILINLTGNAIKFTPRGSVSVVVRSETDQELVAFDVIDTGIGISHEQRRRLFQPFSQGDPSVTRHYGGTGLGLAISRRLARLLGGDLEVESQVSRGSRFTFTLPISNPSGEIANEHLKLAVPIESTAELPDLSGRLLVVEDQPEIRELIRSLLEEAGATVETADDGAEAIERIEAEIQSRQPPIDLVLLDMQMPRVDGYVASSEIRRLGFERPIIALTADAMHGDIRRCLEVGCNAYLAKPIDAFSLVSVVARHLDDERPRRSGAGSDGRRLLVVEDSEDARSVLRELLQLEGFQVDAATDGAEAIALARERPPEVVLLDLGLPGIDGFETLRQMRRIDALRDIRFVAVTGRDDDETRARTRDAGFERLVAKPVDVDRLARWLREG